MKLDEQRLEEEIRALHQQGALLAAFEAALRGYTPWLRGWLLRRLGDENAAKDAFQEISLKVWRGFSGFRWGSRFKTWLCTIAIRELQRPAPPHHSTLDTDGLASPQVSSLSNRLDKRSQLSRLFAQLTEEEQQLVLLRQLQSDASWEELASLTNPDKELSPEAQKREAAKLRQQFSRLMARLRDAAEDEPSLSAWLNELS